MKLFYINFISMVSVVFSMNVIERSMGKLIERDMPIVNERPIIGVLSQEISYNLNQSYPGMHDSFIAASYVKLLEGAGARVVPIWIGRNEDYYEEIMGYINGILFPGGATWFNQSDGYADAGEHIYRIAKRLNDQNEYFPLWGTCLGFELLFYLSADRYDYRARCYSENQPLNLDFKEDFRTSRMFKNAPEDVVSILSTENVTSNFHQYCVTEANLTRFDLDKEWKVISVNDDVNGFNFISAFESNNYPFYGIQFHPEKNIYEWIEKKIIPHSTNSTIANRYFADFFVNETKKSRHVFTNKHEEQNNLIYNFPTTYTALTGSIYEQCYFFNKTS